MGNEMNRAVIAAALAAVASGVLAEDVLLEDGRRLVVDQQMVYVPDPDTRTGLVVMYNTDGSKTTESVSLSGCTNNHGVIAHGEPSTRVVWVADGQLGYDFIARTMCAQKTNGAKVLAFIRQQTLQQQQQPQTAPIPAQPLQPAPVRGRDM